MEFCRMSHDVEIGKDVTIHGFVNLYGGFYCQQGFTYNRRTVNFDQPDIPVSTDMRLDIQYGFKLAWLIPIYKRKPKDYYFN